MDNEVRKIGMLIAAFDAEHERLKVAIGALQKVGGQLSLEVRNSAQGAVNAALAGLNTEVQKAESNAHRSTAVIAWAGSAAARGRGGGGDRDHIAWRLVVRAASGRDHGTTRGTRSAAGLDRGFK